MIYFYAALIGIVWGLFSSQRAVRESRLKLIHRWAKYYRENPPQPDPEITSPMADDSI